MAVIDIRKIDALREVVDSEVAFLVATKGISKPEAYMQLCESLGCYLRIRHWHDDWCNSSAVPVPIVDRLREVPDDDKASDEFVFRANLTECWALNPEDAVIGTVLRLLDSSCDIYSEDFVQKQSIGPEWRRVMNGGIASSRVLADIWQRGLFETEAEYQQRCEMVERLRLFDATWSERISDASMWMSPTYKMHLGSDGNAYFAA